MEPAAESTKGPATDADHTAAAPVLAGHPTLERIYSVGYVYHPQMMLHENVNGHPEEPARISQIYNLLVRNHCIVQMKEIPCREATSDEILLVHSEDLWEKVQALSGRHFIVVASPPKTRLTCTRIDDTRDRTIRGIL